jgi:4-hydroxybutyrate dehydrogenase/sulfolactaldehyde 3-reductase
MGMPMASNLVRKGFDTNGFDVDAKKIQQLATLGARAATSIADAVNGVDVVVTMLPATRHVETVVLGDDGVLAHMPGSAVLMDMSTIDPAGTDKVAAACVERAIAFTDCPVGRLVMHAERGESLFMVGGDDATFARVEPLLNAMGNSIHRCGATGMGTRMKVVNNYMLLVTAQVVAESLVLGTKLGLNVETIKSVTGATTANNGQLQIAFANKVLKGDIEPGFTIDLCYKDIGLAMAAAAEQRIGLPVGAAAYSVIGSARATAYASKDYSALLAYAYDLAGLHLPAK